MNTSFDYRGFLFAAVCVVVVVFGIQTAGRVGEELAQISPVVEFAQGPLAPVEVPEIRLGFVGDIMLDRGVKSKILLHGDSSYDFPFQYASGTLRSYDILFGNLEGPISDVGVNRGSIYSFRMDPRAAVALRDAGFDIVSVANNHIGDWGASAMTDTFARLKNIGIVPVGGGANTKDAHEPRIFQVRGVKIAYLAYSQFGKGYTEAGSTTPGIAVIDKDSVARDVSYAKSIADVAVVSFHFGDEYKDKQNTFQESMGHAAIDAGADLVVGHHPHVIEMVEQYNGKTIVYSLGNFVFDQMFSSKTMTGMMLNVSLKGKSIERVSTTTILINSDFQPQLIQ